MNTGGLTRVTSDAAAEEQSYYKGNSLEIFLNTPDDVDEKAFCAFRSTAWSGKSVAIEYTLIGIDKIVPRLRVSKQNWNLSVGQATNVAIGTAWAGGIEFVSKVVSSDELYGEIPGATAEDGGGFMVTTILGTAISTNKPAPLAVTFQGNEPVWYLPVVSYADAIGLGTGFDNIALCRATKPEQSQRAAYPRRSQRYVWGPASCTSSERCCFGLVLDV
ncbi:hypothetical protein RMR21_001460 [Agrobacterium sp. rho-8.1]|nr:hypothetical protein [Agrobacterium sp. rho-8.1]